MPSPYLLSTCEAEAIVISQQKDSYLAIISWEVHPPLQPITITFFKWLVVALICSVKEPLFKCRCFMKKVRKKFNKKTSSSCIIWKRPHISWFLYNIWTTLLLNYVCKLFMIQRFSLIFKKRRYRVGIYRGYSNVLIITYKQWGYIPYILSGCIGLSK